MTLKTFNVPNLIIARTKHTHTHIQNVKKCKSEQADREVERAKKKNMGESEGKDCERGNKKNAKPSRMLVNGKTLEEYNKQYALALAPAHTICTCTHVEYRSVNVKVERMNK